MNTILVKTFVAAVAVLLLGGCATQNFATKDSKPNLFCFLAGGGVGGGVAAALTAAAGPIGAGAVVGSMLGAYACSGQEEERIARAVPVNSPVVPAPKPVVVLDADGDGVVDANDRCPSTPAGTKVNANGCPDILLTLTGLNFQFDRSDINAASADILDQARATLDANEGVNVRIEGHTDSIGSEAYNMKLSQRRADSVLDYLVRHGIAAPRLTTLGLGETKPVDSNSSSAGRFQNRRVEFRVMGVDDKLSAVE